MSLDRQTQPIFILGNHRSGTSILYRALVERGPFCHPTPYHLAYFEDHLQGRLDHDAALAATRERFERRGIVDRFVDDIPAHALSPEEYGFVLKGGRIAERNLERFRRFCEFVRQTAPADRLLLLKNPRDFANAAFIHARFPGSRFIFIHRHPGPTIDSRIRELRLLFSRRSPYQSEIEPAYDYIMSRPALRGALSLCLRPERPVDLFFLHAFRRLSSRFLRSLEKLPSASHTSLTYEDLCADPERVIGGVLSFLGLSDSDVSGVGEMFRTRAATPNRSRVLRSPRAERMLEPYLEHCGYRGLWPTERQPR